MIMERGKILSSFAGALMLTSMLSFSNAFADTNTPTIPPDGQAYVGQAYLDPAKAPYTVGSLTSTLNTQAFYQGNPYTDANAVRNEVQWNHKNSSWVNDPTAKGGVSKVSFGLATVTLEDGSGRTGNFYLYNIDTLSSNNGYGLISVDDVPAWVQMLGGDLNAIQQDMANGTLDASSYMDDRLNQWHVVHLGQLAKLCGWTLAFDNGTDANNIGDPMNGMYVPTDQTKATPTFKLFPNQNTQNQTNGTGTNGNGGNNGGTNGTGTNGGSNSGNGGNNTQPPQPLPTGGNSYGGANNPSAHNDGDDIAVRFRKVTFFNHLPKDGDIDKIECVLKNTNGYDGYIKYKIDGYADNGLIPPIHLDGISAINGDSEVAIPISFPIKKQWQGDFQLAYHVHFSAHIEVYVPPSSGDDNPPPPLKNGDHTNDDATLLEGIPGSPHLVQ